MTARHSPFEVAGGGTVLELIDATILDALDHGEFVATVATGSLDRSHVRQLYALAGDPGRRAQCLCACNRPLNELDASFDTAFGKYAAVQHDTVTKHIAKLQESVMQLPEERRPVRRQQNIETVSGRLFAMVGALGCNDVEIRNDLPDVVDTIAPEEARVLRLKPAALIGICRCVSDTSPDRSTGSEARAARR
ncbi:hypothetical protein QN224_29560 [Sinorhizobium sp. 8-89]|uniref:hypothetical protein n=1 Tax=Sinorhizobium sp. 7-81 TaxID=3049087 RepID=UPI0024C41AAC|nr:hypothetical protein [Sinorhizobium sp. 7-81]MDK1389530.1 hypothetical protein [Sinorhizobium sp. 7-81]